MARSINGWPVLETDDPKLGTFTVPGTKVRLRLRRDIAPLLLALAADYHREVAPIDVGTPDDWGYAYRPARISSLSWSDHASGTAIDLNATTTGARGSRGGMRWLVKTRRYLKAWAIRRRYKVVIWGGASSVDGVVTGGDYAKPANWDPMHYALAPGTTLKDVQKVIADLRIGPDGRRGPKHVAKPKPKPKPKAPAVRLANLRRGKKNADVRLYQSRLRKLVASLGGTPNSVNPAGATGYFGAETTALTEKAYRLLALKRRDPSWTRGDLSTPNPRLLAELGLRKL